MTAINQEYPTVMLEQNNDKSSTGFCLNKDYSTTRLVTREKPIIENKPEDKFETVLFLPEGEGRKGEGGLRTNGYFKKSMPDKPLISVITVVFNGEKYLEETIQSVIKQTYDNVEYIIIDGGSTDGTLDVIKKYEGQVDYWVSEKDEGIYDAMNKGIRLSTGTFIGLVNADDVLLPDGVARAKEALQLLDEPGYTCGAVELIDQAGLKYGTSSPLPEEQRHRRRYMEMPCPHLGVFVHMNVYERLGLFDIFFRLSADYDLLLRFIENKVPCAHVAESLGQFRHGGGSGGMGTWLETFAVHRKHGNTLGYSLYVFFRSMAKSSLAKVMPRTVKRNIRKHLVSKNNYE